MTETEDAILEMQVTARNYPQSPLSVREIRESGLHVDDLWLPSVVVRRSALEHNLTRFAQWCRDQGVDLAPHGKTSMSPQLWEEQLAHGAWGITAATVSQARIMKDSGIERVLIANEVLDYRQALWLAETNAAPDYIYYSLVDSADGVQLLESAAQAVGTALPVLVELGVAGRRTGVRTLEEGLELASKVKSAPFLVLAGIEGYEGVMPGNRAPSTVDRVQTWMGTVVELLHAVDSAGCFDQTDEIIFTAGGSAFPDVAAEALRKAGSLSKPLRPLVRSGCYITHDHQSYERSSPLRSSADPDPLIPAVTCLARVNSVPESGVALLTVGKRDVPVDIDLPIVLQAADGEGQRRDVEGITVTELNDHHCFLQDPESVLRPGDTVELGLSHPCTTFDKWPLIPVIDDDDQVVDAIRTLF